MKRIMPFALSVWMLGLAGCGPAEVAASATVAADAAPTSGVHMDAETQQRMGVRSESIVAVDAPQAAEGFARVLDVGPLAAIESEVSTAAAAASASNEEYRRLAALAAQDQAASARSVEAARAQAAADSARAKLAGRRIGLEWGAGLEGMSGRERSRLLSDIAAGRAALLRIDAPSVSAKITRASVRLEKGAPPIPVVIIGQAAATDARLQTTGLLAFVRGDAASLLTAGRLMQADLELGAAEAGYLIPDSALIRADSTVLVYLQTGPETFDRREVDKGRAADGGWFVPEGFVAGERVVVEGAASLRAAEAGPIEAE